MVRLPPSRHTLHCGLRIPDLRARDDSPLRRSCHHVGPASCRTRRLRAQRIRRCGLNATFRTRLQRCDGDWWPLSLRHSRVAHAAPLGTNTEICDTVRLGRCKGLPRRKAGTRDSLIEALNLVPDFLEDLVSDNLLDAFSGGVIRVEPLCQIALERSIPKVTDILTATIVAGFGGSFE